MFVLRMQNIPEADRDWWEHIYEQLLHTELDRDWALSIIEGSWPDADEIIKNQRELYEAAVARKHLS